MINKENLDPTQAEYWIINVRNKHDGDEITFEFNTEQERNAFEAGMNYASYGRLEVISRQQISGKFRTTILDREV
jgi:hypothetical protein